MILLVASHGIWLGWLGASLVRDESPVPAGIVVVLAGDFRGARILRAGELIAGGMAPKALVSGTRSTFGLDEARLAIDFAVRSGLPAGYFDAFANDSRSTVEEAGLICPELRRRGVRKFLLVTSDYHSARASRAYRAACRGLEFRTVTCREPEFNGGRWWNSREGRKLFFMEWLKTTTGALGM